MIALTITTIIIMTASVISPPTTAEIIAAMIKMMIIKSLNCSKNFTNKDFFFPSSNSFFPYFSRFSSTCEDVNPFSKSVLKKSFVSSAVMLNQFFFSNLFSPFLFILHKKRLFMKKKKKPLFVFFSKSLAHQKSWLLAML